MGITPSVALAAAALAAASLLTLPAAARAQIDSGSSGAPVGPPAAPTPRQLDVTVDWVDIPDTDVTVTHVGLGPNIDARLMAALIQNGAIDTRGPRLRTTTDVFSSLHQRTDVPTSVAVDGRPQKTVLHLDNFVEATAHINPDGTINVTGGVQRQTLLPHVSPPAASTDYKMLQNGFHDGEPQLLEGIAAAGGGFGGGSAPKHFVFVTVTFVPERTSARK